MHKCELLTDQKIIIKLKQKLFLALFFVQVRIVSTSFFLSICVLH